MMLHSAKRFLAWQASERWIVMQTVVMLPLTALGLRLFGFNRWYAGLARLTKPPNRVTLPPELGGVGARLPELGGVGGAPPELGGVGRRQPEEEATIRRTLRFMRLAVQHGFYGGNCLSRSLTLWRLLRRQGITCDLRIGVRKKEGQFQAHAWVEVQGYPLNDNQQVHQRYVAFEQAIVPKGSIIRP